MVPPADYGLEEEGSSLVVKIHCVVLGEGWPGLLVSRLLQPYEYG